jgi:secondary thiamine-phosphate synthase enzyme
MTARHATFSIRTRGKGTYEITEEVTRIVRESGIQTGTVTVFIRHTSASLVIYENADQAPGRISMTTSKRSPRKVGATSIPSRVRRHDQSLAHGPHRTSEVVPTAGGRMTLGTWQEYLPRTPTRLAFTHRRCRCRGHLNRLSVRFRNHPPPRFSLAQKPEFWKLKLILNMKAARSDFVLLVILGLSLSFSRRGFKPTRPLPA